MASKSSPAAEFLDEVAEQISYRPLRPAIVEELNHHIEDRISEYQDEGCSQNEAEQKAIAAMGDPVIIGTEINAVRHTRNNPALIIFTSLLLLFGFLAASYFYWSANKYGNGFSYYLPGLIVLLLTSTYSYPFVIKYWKKILIFMPAAILLINAVIFMIRLDFYSGLYYLFYLPFRYFYYLALIMAPLLVLAVYQARNKPKQLVLILLAAAGWILFSDQAFIFQGMISVLAVFVISLTGTVCFMIFKRLLGRPCFAAVPLLLVIITFVLLPSQKETFGEFRAPADYAFDTWQDAYNGLLIQELLSKTPMTEGISLTGQELIEYGSGDWYFDDDTSRREHWTFYTDPDDVTIWDILPLHYHNNYLIATSILMFGQWFGAVMLAAIGTFFITIFRCIMKIQGRLAACMSFGCALVLLTQTVFYILGNFGYQYGPFTAMPLLSEGWVSIIINMALLGFIFSAYRYDKVVDEKIVYHTT